MNYQVLLLFTFSIIFLYGIYSTNKAAKTIHCRYSSRAKQSIEKDIPLASNYVLFEKKKCYVIPSCVTTQRVKKGIHALFPTTRLELSFVWNSPYPVDPNTGNPVMLSPEVEKALDQETALGDYAGSQQRAVMGKAKIGGLEKWLPWIAIAGIVIIALFLYTMYQDQNTMKQFLSDIYTKIGGTNPVK